ncbi:MAG: hypothetical protein ABWY23_07690 [Mycetocola sp.]
MEGFTPYSDADRELDELSRRAYGRHPHIDVDPAGLARLPELDAAHRDDAARRPDSFTSASGTGIAPAAAPIPSLSAEDSVAQESNAPAAAGPRRVKKATPSLRSRFVWPVGVLDVSSSGDGFEGFEGRAGDGIVRFMLQGDAVDAYVHLTPESDL